MEWMPFCDGWCIPATFCWWQWHSQTASRCMSLTIFPLCPLLFWSKFYCCTSPCDSSVAWEGNEFLALHKIYLTFFRNDQWPLADLACPFYGFSRAEISAAWCITKKKIVFESICIIECCLCLWLENFQKYILLIMLLLLFQLSPLYSPMPGIPIPSSNVPP